MANRFRQFIESIVYFGMTPGKKGQPAPDGKSHPFHFLERFLSGPAHDDPFYVTNQTVGQKAKRALVLSLPLVIVIGALLVVVIVYGPKTKKPERELTPAEVAAKILPNFNNNIRLPANKDLEVMEVHFDYSGPGHVVGQLRNTSDRAIREAVVVFDLVDATKSQLGGVTVTETNLAPGEVRKFHQAIEQKNAAYAVVRDLRTQ